MDNRITIILELLSAGVIASLVAGIFSLIIAFKNNKRLVELEKSKQKFTVNQERYVQIDPSVIEQARQMDLLSYLQRYEPSTLI